jgi:template-activating factor I
VLKKEYWIRPSNVTGHSDADGIPQAMFDYSSHLDMDAQATKIAWKDDSRCLTKLFPLSIDEKMIDLDPGSFFNFFETAVATPTCVFFPASVSAR